MNLTLSLLLALGSAADPPPNVLVILLDDWGVDRFDAHAPSPARTPFLDRLASLGLRFTRAYADPLCSPSRSAALTGRLGIHTGVTGIFPWVETTPTTPTLDPASYATLPEVLGRAGYATAAIGKWHLTGTNWEPDPFMHPIEFGFDLHRGPITNFILSQGWTYYDYPYNLATEDGARQVQESSYATTRQVDDALDWILEQDRPWFCWLALNAPHRPWDLPPQSLVSVDLATVDTEPEQYDAVLEAADTEITRLIVTLTQAGRLDDTYVIVTGDNGTPGGAFGGLPQPKKGTVFEGGIHVPLVVWHSRLRAATSAALVHVVDLYATILELAGLTPPPSDSVSVAPLVEGFRHRARDWVYCAMRSLDAGPENLGASAVVGRKFKLHRNSATRLYKLLPGGNELLINPPYNAVQSEAFEYLRGILVALEGS